MAEKEQQPESVNASLVSHSAKTISVSSSGLGTSPVVDANASLTSLAASMARVTKNDNKRRGFKNGMDLNPLPSTQNNSASHTGPSPTNRSVPRRLVPPSERTDLPSNLIVTSVDVEAGEWDLSTAMKVVQPEAMREDDANFMPTQREAEVIASNSQFLWNWGEVERKWDRCPVLLASAPINQGTVLLWKELALHPTTFTPEVMVHAATVEEITPEGVTLKIVPHTEADDELEEIELVIKKREELVDHRVYS